jgi:parallel beta-helix repeat protein
MKNLTLALTLLLTWIPLCLLNANVRNVPGTYTTIQSAINASVDRDTILVAPGIYFENINYRGKGIVLASYFLTTHDTSFISNTIINGSMPIKPDSASTVIITNSNISHSHDSLAVLMGFTITGGHGVVWVDVLYPTTVYREGAGILIQNCSPTIKYNRIIGNSIYDTLYPFGGGGGIHYGNGNPIIENNVFQNNFAYCGMGICIYGAAGIVRNNIFSGNFGGRSYGAGTIYTFYSFEARPVIIENNTIVNNTVDSGTAGLRLFNSMNNIARNNIVWGNYSPTQASQISISQCTPSISYNDIQGGWSGTGNINANPQFISGTFYLNPTSPCVDAGDTSSSFKDPEDSAHTGFALWPALGMLRNDMGAYGGPHCSIMGSSVIGIKNNVTNSIITDFALFQNYPNPFNPATNIKFQIPKNSFVILKIFDILGREVAVLVNEKLHAGEYEIPFSNDMLISGIYFYRLEAGDFVSTRKMILVK